VELYLHFPSAPSWCGAQLNYRDNFTFTFTSELHSATDVIVKIEDSQVGVRTVDDRALLVYVQSETQICRPIEKKDDKYPCVLGLPVQKLYRVCVCVPEQDTWEP
jgi:hypothetical protein